MRKFLLAATLLTTTPAFALQTPKPMGDDPHVQVAIFNPSEPVLVVGAVGRPLTITFGETEHIIRVVLETSGIVDGKAVPAPWSAPDKEQIASAGLGNVLPMWAMRAGHSNAQVITRTEDGQQRPYQLHLIALPPQPDNCDSDDCDDPRLTTGLTFRYPVEQRAKANQVAVQAAIKARAAAEKATAEERLKTDIFYGKRNWKYIAKGKPQAIRDLAPDEVSDNTQVTAFRYRGNRHVPAFYSIEPGKEPRRVNLEPRQDMLIAYETAAHWRLRVGGDEGEVVDIFNQAFDPIGANPQTGTTSPEVLRVTRTQAVP